MALLAVVAALCLGTIIFAALHALTAHRIVHNERAWLTAQLEALVPQDMHDNDLLDDRIAVSAPELLGTDDPVPVYRARLHGEPTAVIIASVAPDGYGGPIQLLVGIRYDGTLLGVRVPAHHETPNMGNDFELPGSHWLDDFRGHSLVDPEAPGWNVRKDGGQFDQFTSATITPRAIVHAVQHTLDYYQRHRATLFTPAT